MPVWHTRPVDEQDSLTLSNWQVVQLSNGDRHLVGYCVENREGRVSSVVRELDTRELCARTATGRIYTLRGQPGGNLDAAYVWKQWAALNSVDSWKDVTTAIWQEHRDARST